jgi:methylase of polypeptide subunit release factors
VNRALLRIVRDGVGDHSLLAQSWFPAIEGLVERLDDGARVADLGCGHGAATLIMARTWPRSEFTGFDIDEPSVTVRGSITLHLPLTSDD